MHSFLLISKDQPEIDKKIEEILSENKIDRLDRSDFSFEKAVGIEDVRKIQEKLYLKPMYGDKKAIILDFRPEVTTEAQNALLKTLEEPPRSTIVIIFAGNIEDLLPTILSRCKIYKLEGAQEESEDFSKQIIKILDSGEGEKLEIAAEFGRDRETALKFAENIVLGASKLLKENPTEKTKNLMKEMDKAYSTLKNSNVNPRLILENYLLSL